MPPKKAKKTKKQIEEERCKLKNSLFMLIFAYVQRNLRKSAFVRRSLRESCARRRKHADSKKKPA